MSGIKVGDRVKLRRATVTPTPMPYGTVGRLAGDRVTVRFLAPSGVADETFALDELERVG
jgi:hypothetical protein